MPGLMWILIAALVPASALAAEVGCEAVYSDHGRISSAPMTEELHSPGVNSFSAVLQGYRFWAVWNEQASTLVEKLSVPDEDGIIAIAYGPAPSAGASRNIAVQLVPSTHGDGGVVLSMVCRLK